MIKPILRGVATTMLGVFVAVSMMVLGTTIGSTTEVNMPGVAQAHACAWQQPILHSSGPVGDWSGHVAVGIWTWTDGCGTYGYETTLLPRDGGSPYGAVSTLRIWRCNRYYAQTMVSGWETQSVIVSGYGSCGPQADSYGTSFTMPSGRRYTVYVSVG